VQLAGIQKALTPEILPVEWYAVYTKHQHEKTAANYLASNDFEVLLPLYRASHRGRGRATDVFLPVFPCYLFIRASLSRRTDILKTPGVFWLLENSGRACSVPEADMEAVRKIAESPRLVEPHEYLKLGDIVRIREGSLSGITGILTRVKNRYRVVLTIELLKKSVSVEVDFSAVDRVS
jgi:transcription antitermination factor NusG